MRIRTIKPEFWYNEELASISEAANMLAIGLLNYSDDEGYFKANTSLIKSAVFPLREPSRSITVMLHELSSIGYIELAKGSDNHDYGRVVNFGKHQVVNHPQPSKIKGLFGVQVALPEHYGNDTVTLPPGMELNGNRMEGNICRESQSSSRPLAAEIPDLSLEAEEIPEKREDHVEKIVSHYKTYHPKARPGKKEIGLIKARMKDYSVEDICHAIDGYHRSPYHTGQNETGTKYLDLELILRSSSKVQRGIEMNEQQPTGNKAIVAEALKTLQQNKEQAYAVPNAGQ